MKEVYKSIYLFIMIPGVFGDSKCNSVTEKHLESFCYCDSRRKKVDVYSILSYLYGAGPITIDV